jgi:tRNA-2-methylthio-N6-dimethylallyladenosine synthase
MSNGITALVSITRGCDICAMFCVVPLPVDENAVATKSIMKEIQIYGTRDLKRLHFGQNVDSYLGMEVV